MPNNATAQSTVPIAPQVDLYIPASIVASSAITIGVGTFAVKWMFGQIVRHWEEKLAELTESLKILSGKEEDLKDQITALDRKMATECLSREEWLRDVMKIQSQFDRLEARMVSQFDRIIDKIGGGRDVK